MIPRRFASSISHSFCSIVIVQSVRAILFIVVSSFHSIGLFPWNPDTGEPIRIFFPIPSHTVFANLVLHLEDRFSTLFYCFAVAQALHPLTRVVEHEFSGARVQRHHKNSFNREIFERASGHVQQQTESPCRFPCQVGQLVVGQILFLFKLLFVGFYEFSPQIRGVHIQRRPFHPAREIFRNFRTLFH